MEIKDRIELNREIVNRLTSARYYGIRFTGFCRFSIKNNNVVEKSLTSIIFGACVVAVMILLLIHVVYNIAIVVKYLLFTELSILLEVAILIILVVLNITFSNRNGVAKIIHCSIDIDLLLGWKETKFMREVVDRLFLIMNIPVAVMQVLIVTLLYATFKVSMAVHVTGSLIFLWFFCIFYDINFILIQSLFLSLRTNYLNVAMMKALNVESEYIPDLFLFSGLFWKSKYNDLVQFHKRANVKQFVDAYKMLFKYMQLYQTCYQFLIFASILIVTIGTLLSIQSIIIYGRAGVDKIRQSIMVLWVGLSWLFLLMICISLNVFSRQIDQTKLICTFAQLRSITNEGVYRFTKAVLRAIEYRVDRMSIYGLFVIDPGVLLRILASTFVYVTAQLQLTMPPKETNFYSNSTTVAHVEESTNVSV